MHKPSVNLNSIKTLSLANYATNFPVIKNENLNVFNPKKENN